MGKVNLSRVILGGIVAGIVLNISEWLLHDVVMKEQFRASLQALGKTPMESGSVILWWVIWSFILGITAVWIYAAIRPRYGAGAGTAARAGVAVWVLSCLLFAIAMTNLGLFPLMPLAIVWSLVGDIVATVAGAWLYKENPV